METWAFLKTPNLTADQTMLSRGCLEQLNRVHQELTQCTDYLCHQENEYYQHNFETMICDTREQSETTE